MSPRISFTALALASGLLALGCSSPSSTPTAVDGAAPPADAAAPAADAAAPAAAAEPAPTAVEPEEPGSKGSFTLVTDQKTSTITWTAIKNGEAKVVGEFTQLTGGLYLDPTDLSKVDGNIGVQNKIDSKNPVRDANILELLFGIVWDKTTIASVGILSVSPEKNTLDVGESTQATVSYSLGLPSGAVADKMEVTLSRPDAERWVVTSKSPISLSLKGLNMTEQVAALRERCAHQSIDDGVEISVALEFVPRKAD